MTVVAFLERTKNLRSQTDVGRFHKARNTFKAPELRLILSFRKLEKSTKKYNRNCLRYSNIVCPLCPFSVMQANFATIITGTPYIECRISVWVSALKQTVCLVQMGIAVVKMSMRFVKNCFSGNYRLRQTWTGHGRLHSKAQTCTFDQYRFNAGLPSATLAQH